MANLQTPAPIFKNLQFVLITTLLLVFGATAATAEEKKSEEKELKVQTGTVASFGSHKGAAAVDSTSLTEMDEEPSAVSGSIMQKKGRCVARLTNNGKKSHSVRYRVVVTGGNGKERSRRSYSSSIGAGKSIEKAVSCPKGANASIEIIGGR